MSAPNLAALISKFGFSRAVFVCGIGLLVMHVVTFEQLIILVLFGLGMDRVTVTDVNDKAKSKNQRTGSNGAALPVASAAAKIAEELLTPDGG